MVINTEKPHTNLQNEYKIKQSSKSDNNVDSNREESNIAIAILKNINNFKVQKKIFSNRIETNFKHTLTMR